MLVIRLFRVGKKNQPSFKIVVTDKRRPSRAGRFVEEVGFYNPLKKQKILKAERIKYWLSVGAKPSATIHNLLVSEKLIEGEKIPKHKEKPVKEEAKAGVKPVEEKPAEKAPKKEELPKEKKPLEEKQEPSKEEKQEKPAEPEAEAKKNEGKSA